MKKRFLTFSFNIFRRNDEVRTMNNYWRSKRQVMETKACRTLIFRTMTELNKSKFVPLHLTSEWVEPGSTTRRLTERLLPLFNTPFQFLACVGEGGCILNFVVIWSSLLVNLKHLHLGRLLSKNTYHMKMFHLNFIKLSLKSCCLRKVTRVKLTAQVTLFLQFRTQIA